MRNSSAALLGWAMLGVCVAGIPAHADSEDLKVALSREGDSLRVLVVNISDHQVRVNTRLAYGADLPFWEVYFEIKDAHGKAVPFSALEQIGIPRETDWQNLAPGQAVGTKVPVEMLGAEYSLERGRYDITANYRIVSSDNKILQSFRSNTVRIVMRTGADEHTKQLEKAGYMFPVDISDIVESRKKKQH